MGLFRRRSPGRHAGPGGVSRAIAPATPGPPPWEQAGWTPPAYAQPYLEAAPYDEPAPLAAELPPVEELVAPFEPVADAFEPFEPGAEVPPPAELPSYRPPPFAFAAPRQEPDATPEQAPGPRVELGFRDGSVAALAPDSVQARALSAIVDVLVRRD